MRCLWDGCSEECACDARGVSQLWCERHIRDAHFMQLRARRGYEFGLQRKGAA